MKNKIFIRVLLSAICYMLSFAVIDYFFDGLFKSILCGISAAAFVLYNQKKNLEYKKAKDNN